MKVDPRQLKFWQDAQDSLFSWLSQLLADTYYDGVDEGVNALPANAQALVDYNLVNTSALQFAKSYDYHIIKGITDTTREQTMTAITNWMQSGAPLGDLETALEPIYGEVRAKMIAATEVTRVYAQGNNDAWNASGVVEQCAIMTAEDDRVCDICGPLGDPTDDNNVVDVDDASKTPPFHVLCRCWRQPIVSLELSNEKVAKILNAGAELRGRENMAAVLKDGMLLYPQINPDPLQANADWLNDHNPRVALYAEGKDPSGNLIMAWMVDGTQVRNNIWQDWCEGGNHSRYPWIPLNEYWLGESHINELDYNLIHETVEDRKMQEGTSYDDAHSYTANPVEYQARHGTDPKEILRQLGWNV